MGGIVWKGVAGAAPARSEAISSVVAVSMEPGDLLDVVLATLDDGKAEAVTTIDLRGRSAFADHLVIATGRSQRQLAALADHLEHRLKLHGLPSSIEGLPQGDWVLIDAGDIVIHLFRPDVRSFYNIERMWGAPEPLAMVGNA